ncbi:transposase [Streptomyces scopuliridis]|uniref:Transposase n=2 Tax=Streptomyces scopuliridis TaxID=452529 RepID=A0ACD4ZWJ6_9ACTN|nr:Tn3 family transposase [Streptomyces scopuliridis]WSC02387.1 transposase [Streptomyces scopuliridis]WSC04077.1 transposase [Streptomyces scopuliridis]
MAWSAGSGGRGVRGRRSPSADRRQTPARRRLKFNALLTNAVIFHNALDIAEIVRRLLEEGWEIGPEDLAHISPYLTEHIKRFGEYSTHELGIRPVSTSPSSATRTCEPRASARRPDRPLRESHGPPCPTPHRRPACASTARRVRTSTRPESATTFSASTPPGTRAPARR